MKKKIFIIAVAVCLAVLSIAGSSIAYFTDTEEYTNVFTAGKVEIILTEAAVESDAVGNLVKDADADRIVINEAAKTTDYGKIFPSQSIYKDPTIEIDANSESAFVGAIISIESTVFASIVADYQLDEFLTGLNSDDAADVTYEKTTNGYKIYMIYEKPLAVGTEYTEYTLFNGIKVFDNWDHTEMNNLKDLEIVINAYATQTAGFADAKTALTTAFADKGWNNVPTVAIPANPTNP